MKSRRLKSTNVKEKSHVFVKKKKKNRCTLLFVAQHDSIACVALSRLAETADKRLLIRLGQFFDSSWKPGIEWKVSRSYIASQSNIKYILCSSKYFVKKYLTRRKFNFNDFTQNPVFEVIFEKELYFLLWF